MDGKGLNQPVEVDTSNGKVELLLPPEAGARVDARTSNGKIQVAGQSLGKNINQAILRSGGPLFTIRTSNGNVIVN